MTAPHRSLLLGGVIGPTAFVAAWGVGGIIDDRQLSPIDDAISQLAHVDAGTRWLMTAGFLLFGLGVGLFAVAARPLLGAATSFAYLTAAVSTAVVAGFPLGRSVVQDRLHGLAAGIGYLAFVCAPIFAFGGLVRLDRRQFATTGVVVSAIAGVMLAVSSTSAPTGLTQRLGLTVLDAWTIGLSIILWSRCEPQR